MEPTIKWYLNLGSDNTNSVNWHELNSSTTIYFTGPDTTSNKEDSITPATYYPYKWAEELWISSSNYSNSSQCKLYTSPEKDNQVANILRITFENDSTSTPPILTAYDNSSANSITNQMFGGEPGRMDSKGTNYTPWLKGIETTNKNTPSQNWIFGIEATSNTTTANALGSDYKVTCATNAGSNSAKTFALACAVPSDAIQGEHEWVYTIEYTYS